MAAEQMSKSNRWQGPIYTPPLGGALEILTLGHVGGRRCLDKASPGRQLVPSIHQSAFQVKGVPFSQLGVESPRSHAPHLPSMTKPGAQGTTEVPHRSGNSGGRRGRGGGRARLRTASAQLGPKDERRSYVVRRGALEPERADKCRSHERDKVRSQCRRKRRSETEEQSIDEHLGKKKGTQRLQAAESRNGVHGGEARMRAEAGLCYRREIQKWIQTPTL